MYKSICVVVILLAAFAFISGGRSADASQATPPSAVIVARAKLVNQTAPIPTRTIFTPTQDGLYRLSVYMTISMADPSSISSWYYGLNWSDAAGAEQSGSVLSLPGYLTPNQAWAYNSGGWPGQVMTFQANAGSPISYSVVQSNGSDSSAFLLYYTLERLE